MGNKGSSGTITQTAVRKILETAADRLSSPEEKTLRMRTGAGVGKDAPLPRRGQKSPEARAELAALEIELVRKLALRSAAAKASEPQVRTREKDKIIRALRRLK
jgi:hypothetical protein